VTARDHPGTPSAAGKDIFVLGLDEGNRRVLEAMPDAGRYRFHQVLGVQELYGGVISFGAEEIDTIEGSVAGTTINLVAHTGDRLSHMHAQNSYSYELANVYIGAADEAELNTKFHYVSTTLRYEIDDAPTRTTRPSEVQTDKAGPPVAATHLPGTTSETHRVTLANPSGDASLTCPP
jgi:hypothetical protein